MIIKLVKLCLLMIVILFALVPVACGGEEDAGVVDETIREGENRTDSVAAGG